ncbi:MAG TPA: hypothetical protein VM536_02520 [Chloroflexia bacterium]|nr:hypothetical protein [Chloroflexia bacterium]
MKRTGFLALLLTVLMLGLLVSACGTLDDDIAPAVGEEGTPAAGTTPKAGGSSGGAAAAEAKVGEAVSLGDWTMTLKSATVEEGVLKANFVVDNSTGKASIPLLSGFTAADAKGGALDTNIVCSTLPGRADPSKTVEGLNCWNTGETAATGMVLKYSNPSYASKTVTWTLP